MDFERNVGEMWVILRRVATHCVGDEHALHRDTEACCLPAPGILCAASTEYDRESEFM